jgi:protoheme IX farnesyltransferase
MMLICALVGMLLAEETISSVSTILIALIGIALCSGLSCLQSTKLLIEK